MRLPIIARTPLPSLAPSHALGPDAPHAGPLLPPSLLLADGPSPSFSITDTLADLAVYALLAGTAVLTLYSLYVTLSESNKKAGGWEGDLSEAEAEARRVGERFDAESKLQKGMIYDPVTEQWAYKEESGAPASTPRVGGGTAGGTATINRYVHGRS